MGLFSKSDGPVDASWIRATAIVVAADAPPQGAPSRGPNSYGSIEVFADVPGIGRRLMTTRFRYSDTHWVVPGMDVPIAVDPGSPDTFVVDWLAVPTMQHMAEANHPALADPFAASGRVAATVGITPSEKTAARLERFQQAVAAAAALPAPVGRIRAVAMTVSARGRYDSGDDDVDGSGGSLFPLAETSQTVLSVAIPGRSPYAVYVPKFKFPARRHVLPGEAMPAAVSASNPQDVEILWREMPGMEDQLAARVADSVRSNERLHEAMNAQHQAMIAQAVANSPQIPTGGPQPGPYPAAGVGMSPQARQMIVDNLKRALMYVPDPAQRQMMINQYRATGLDITAEELGL